MVVLYGREITISAAGLVIHEPRITVQLSREIDSTESRGTARVYNLSGEHEARIRDRGGPIRIEAGYPGTVGVIFDGEVQRVVRAREDLARITRIEFSDQVRAPSRPGGTFMRSYAGQVAIRTIVADIVRDGLGLAVGPLDPIPADATFPNYYWSGVAAGALDAALRPTGVRWFESDGVVRFNKTGEAQSDAPRVTISPQTGLIGAPRVTDEGAEIKAFLQPAVVPGSIIDLESDALSGEWKVASMSHNADNWTGPFETSCDLRELTG